MADAISLDAKSLSIGAFLLIASSLAARGLKQKKTLSPLPPGPKPWPVVGSALGLDPNQPWVTFKEWGTVCGSDIVYANLFGQDVVVVNSEKIAKDLMEHRSNKYSDRPHIATNDFYGLSYNSILLPYGDRWRLHRRLFQQACRPEAARTYRTMQLRQARQLVQNILLHPAEYESHLKTHAASIIMSIVYGYAPEPLNDSLVNMIEEGLPLVSEAMRPENSGLITVLPILKYIPLWMPGSRMRRNAIKCFEYSETIMRIPFEKTQKNMAEGRSKSCMVSSTLEKMEDGSEAQLTERGLKECAATISGAASETTSSTLLVFILAMVLNPEVQKKAQAEVDYVVGLGNLPDYTHQSMMPYVEAVLRETLRWHPVAPFAIPHATSEDDVYEGAYIPKGATVIPNLWAMSRDPKYDQPEDFNPERFLNPDGTLNDDDVSYAFGFGRRVCVGRYVAEASVWTSIASLLAAFSFEKAKDEQGRPVDFEVKWTTGITSFPELFPFKIVPRHASMTPESVGALMDELRDDEVYTD